MIDVGQVVSVLSGAQIDFVLIGGAAMVAHGSAHVTADVDVCYGRTPENIQRLAEALKPYHPRLRGAPSGLPFVFDADTIKHGLNFTLTTDLGDLDLLGEVAGLGFYDSVRSSSTSMEIYGRECHVLSLDGLIKAKRAAGRPRDLAAISELEALRELSQNK